LSFEAGLMALILIGAENAYWGLKFISPLVNERTE
jgi:hypothetical protein